MIVVRYCFSYYYGRVLSSLSSTYVSALITHHNLDGCIFLSIKFASIFCMEVPSDRVV
jgi:hypothetical protein